MAHALLTLSGDAALTAAFARALASDLRTGDVLLLDGPVGAGKSHFARALIRARLQSPDEDVPSPTFTLVQSYDSAPPIWHADLYRLTDPAEVDELGLTDAMPDAISLIEWPDRMALPPAALTISLRPLPDPDLREITLAGDEPLLSRAGRAARRAGFAHAAGWGGAEVAFLAGDASARRYFRLVRGTETAVLMDTDEATLTPYLAMTGWLAARGFDVPRIIASDAQAGLALIEDFGDAQVGRVIGDDPAMAGPLYLRIALVLARLAGHAPAPGLKLLDGPELAAQVGLFAQYYLPAAGGDAGAQAAADQIAPVIARLHARLCTDLPGVTGLRDFHAENIILTPDNRLGLLDFQDAVLVHPAYDLVSVLHDPRRSLPDGTEEAAITRFLDETGFDPDRFRAAFAFLGLARNLRIMGIYTRLCIRDGKPHYLRFMPRLWSLIMRELQAPELAELAVLIARIPPPDEGVIERISRQCCP
ncbi:MAG: tRNA (adenosine(37)-N6)-threonylcarbamoyltransferase complex ATPase subunit type 1 TsaE [Paracoccus sp. (in: a-proteobacteria)]|nr:tRNA (adenosine(37)-N6)-threonylcarbamoyltransferase complex ATPase subunit type 1 TsaE [Paracoccus sp. (in: a-proteobacteria)]